MWGIIEADIEGVTQNDVEKNILSQLEPAVVKAAEKQIRERFIHTDIEDPVIQELYRCSKIRIAEEIARKDPTFKVYAIPVDYYFAIIYNLDDKILSDKRIRYAIAHAITEKN